MVDHDKVKLVNMYRVKNAYEMQDKMRDLMKFRENRKKAAEKIE